MPARAGGSASSRPRTSSAAPGSEPLPPYRVGFVESADREFLALPKRIRRTWRRAFGALTTHPRAPHGLPKGFEVVEHTWGEWEGYFCLKSGEHRALYGIDDRLELVRIERVRHRSEIEYERGPDIIRRLTSRPPRPPSPYSPPPTSPGAASRNS